MNRTSLLQGAIAPQLLGLAWPVLVVLALQTFVRVAETYFVSFLGTDALAGVALVFPLFMLMTMMSNGAMGGGVSSAIARARRRPHARRPGAGAACRGARARLRRGFHRRGLGGRA